MSKRESELKSALMKLLRVLLPSFVHLRHENVRGRGHPDISTTGNGFTTWLEVKHGTPNFESQGIQQRTMQRLALAGFARYLVYQEQADGTHKRTLIIHPRDMHTRVSPKNFVTVEEEYHGFDHEAVIDFLKRMHGVI